jgi:hypothetical protein
MNMPRRPGDITMPVPYAGAFEYARRQAPAVFLGQHCLGRNADRARVDALGVGQELAAHARIAAVGADQHVAAGGAAVGEMENDRTVVWLLVMREYLAEVDDAVEAAEQYPPQRDAARRAVLRDRARVAAELDGQQFLHLLAEKAEAPVADAAGRSEDLEKIGRQAGVEGLAALGADVDAIAL